MKGDLDLPGGSPPSALLLFYFTINRGSQIPYAASFHWERMRQSLVCSFHPETVVFQGHKTTTSSQAQEVTQR